MGIEVRLGDLVDDRAAIIAGLHGYLNPLTDERRFEWLFAENPDGPGRIWVIEDQDSKQIVGSSCVLPRLFYVNGRKILGCVMADTWVHPDYRVLGPALKLQRACLNDISTGIFGLGYDYPRQAMPAIYKRFRITPRDTLVDFVRILRFDTYLANRLGNYGPVRFLARLANLALRCLSPRRTPVDIEIRLEDEDCGPEYTRLHEATVGETTCVARTAEYLNWRYRRHFHNHHEFLVARRNGKLFGYLVFFVADPVRATGIDVVCENDEDLYLALFNSLIRELTRRGCQSIVYPTLATGRVAKTLRKLRFLPKNETPFVLMAADEFAEQVGGELGEFALGQEAD